MAYKNILKYLWSSKNQHTFRLVCACIVIIEFLLLFHTKYKSNIESFIWLRQQNIRRKMIQHISSSVVVVFVAILWCCFLSVQYSFGKRINCVCMCLMVFYVSMESLLRFDVIRAIASPNDVYKPHNSWHAFTQNTWTHTRIRHCPGLSIPFVFH